MQLSFEKIQLEHAGFRLELELQTAADILMVQGSSGSGKSLLLRLLAGLERAQQGSIHFNQQLWSGPGEFCPAHQRPISLAFQDQRLFPHLTVEANLGFGGASRAQVRQLAERFEISQLLGRYPVRLSGGEKQRVAVLRALLKPCELLLLDEPFSALNSELQLQWLQELDACRREQGFGLVFVSHQAFEQAYWPQADCLTLQAGKVLSFLTASSKAES